MPEADMWKVLLLLACTAGSLSLITCDVGDTKPTAETNPTAETKATAETKPTGETGPTDSGADPDDESRSCGCGGHPPKCGKNEVYNNCTYTGCIPRKCSELGFPLNCDKKCTPGCVCKDNYVRNDDGICIPIPDCPSCGGDKNAQQGCGSHCGHSCSDYNKPPKPCPLLCIFNGCVCRPGFVYDNNVKACVKPKDCTPICQVNEEYSSCVNGGCSARNCSQLGKPVPCVDPKYCIKGCVCVTGYLRAANGTCVPKDQCTPKCDKPNEVYDKCPAPCPPRRCDVNEAVIKCKAPPKPGDPECNPGCRCADNYYRNATGTCVLKKHCEKPLKCDCPNEVYNACPGICPPQECGVGIIFCPRNPEYGDPNCRPSCICIDGYVRNDAKECIPKDDCPKCGKNEHWVKCITDCSNQTCADIGKVFHCPNIPAGKCKSGCRCDPGTWRDANNVCVPEKECPKTCGPNEHWEDCVVSCANDTCDNIGKSYSCPAKQNCKGACRCDKGYWRDKNGVCIPECKCPKPCGQNEYWEECIIGCSTQSCEEVGRPARSCPAEIEGQCNSGCRCKPKYFRNADNVCIPERECPKCGKNEHWVKCITDCSNQTCADIGKVFHCPNIPAGKCKSGCRCDPGTWRDANNVCVPQDECPKPECPDGSIWDWCPTVKCDGDYCPKTRDSPQTCPVGIVCDKPRCVCAYNRKRDWKTGKCIPIPDCPPFKCDCNEKYQACPSGCPGDSCSAYINKPNCSLFRIGIIVNCRPQCTCAKGYCRNDKGTCIPTCQCE